MREEDLRKIPRLDAERIVAQVPGGPGYEARILVAVESAMSQEWWRGYYAGRSVPPAKSV